MRLVLLTVLVALVVKILFSRSWQPPKEAVEPMIKFAVNQFEQNRLPDWFTRPGTRFMLSQKVASLQSSIGPDGSESHREYVRNFTADLRTRAIAEQTTVANEQHYEVDTRFYNLVLGKRRKYSSALYPDPATPIADASALLDEAEERMLQLYASRASIRTGDRLRVMDLGCGWGSVTLWFAETFPQCDFVGLSNSRTQREYIMGEAKKRGLTNVEVITGDISKVQLPQGMGRFDRVISIEMFEHMKNYQLLLRKVAQDFLKEEGLLFVHIFVHKTHPYHFTIDGDAADWMTEHFFRGGTMPADDTLLHFQEDLHLVDRWRVDGRHYSLTLDAWLQRMDAHAPQVEKIFAEVYGEENVVKWVARWRAFFFVCSEVFSYNQGREWYVSHYLFQKKK